MRRPLASALLPVVVVALALAGCASPAQTPPDVTDGPGATGSAATGGEPGGSGSAVPESPIAGVVIAVDSQGLDDVRGFTLRSSGGTELVFVIGELENGDEFPPGHLTEHLAAASPVLVFFRAEDGILTAYRIEDAG